MVKKQYKLPFKKSSYFLRALLSYKYPYSIWIILENKPSSFSCNTFGKYVHDNTYVSEVGRCDLWYVQISFLLHVARKSNHYSY